MTTPDPVRALFDSLAEDYDRRYPGAADGLDAFVARLPKGGRVLDIGCGPGVTVAELARRGFDAWGIDLAPKMIARARREHPGLRFEVGDMKRLPAEPASLDGIVSAFSIIFLPSSEVVSVLRAFATALAPRGHLLVTVQEGSRDIEGAPRIYTHPRLLRDIQEGGFEVVEDFFRRPRSHEMQYTKRTVIARKA